MARSDSVCYKLEEHSLLDILAVRSIPDPKDKRQNKRSQLGKREPHVRRNTPEVLIALVKNKARARQAAWSTAPSIVPDYLLNLAYRAFSRKQYLEIPTYRVS